jgi:integrase/recombinase XerD
VAGWRLAGLPKAPEPDQLRRLLAACDRGTATGRRDYAIMLLLSRLGLRAGEVARLGLDDIDWRRGEIVIVGQGNRAERLPLPAEITMPIGLAPTLIGVSAVLVLVLIGVTVPRPWLAT